MPATILEHLNPQQLEAVTLPDQSALVLAGAGSGKTRVLTTRIAWLIQTGRVAPAGVLAVTFTNKAAKEMLGRVSAMLPINTRGMWIGTFHGLCNRLLRAHHRDAGLPQLFQIMDSQDQLALIKRLLKSLNVDDEKHPPRELQYFINANKEMGVRPQAVDAADDITRKLAGYYAAYEELCGREGVVDFAELLLRSFELLSRNQILLEHYQDRFRHILVDEFQDTNRLQYRWLKTLAGKRNAVFAVGDDDQSIYAFRGANTQNMRDFESEFSVGRVIKLEQNYRSQGNILDAANTLIRQNQSRLGKNLWTAEGKGEQLRVYEAANDVEEAGFIVEEAKALHAEGVDLADIALLYRSNAQSRALEHALFAAGISYRVYGGLRFFERQEIKHALAYLRLAANPDDDGALLRVINFPARGVGGRSLEQLQEAALAAKSSLWAAAKMKSEAAKPKSGADTPTKGVEGFVALIDALRAAAQGLPLPEIVEHVVELSGLKAHYQSEKEGADRLENLSQLAQAADAFVHEEEDDSLTAFLAHAALEAGEHQAQAGADALQLMTVHSAKGLEFHAVFISGLEEGLFPHENSVTEPGGLEEERRLMYVAITRARKRLYLTLAQTRMLHGQTRYNIGSRFLEEIPGPLLRRLNAPRPAPAFAFAAKGALDKKYFTPRFKSMERKEAWPAPGKMAQKSSSPWRIGQNVVHPKFGAGVIVDAEGAGLDARVQVNFGGSGLKWLALQYAKLESA